ncbi:MAG: SufS family cysteine desulfurase [Myxococcaceae bacterium]|nr:SufS family cysteine desulfurase [Myxococcaceae bacterium]
MSTPESSPDGLPPQTQLPVSQAPRPTETPTQWAPTPGVSTSAVKHPGAPTVPEFDTAFAGVLARFANELFQPAVPSQPSAVGPSVTPQVPALSPQPAAPGLAPGAASSGFQPTPDVTTVRGQGLPQTPFFQQGFSVPLVDDTAKQARAEPAEVAAPAGLDTTTGYPLGALGGPTQPPTGHTFPAHTGHPTQPEHNGPHAPGDARHLDGSDLAKRNAQENTPAAHGASPAAEKHTHGDSPFTAPLSFDALGDRPDFATAQVPHLDTPFATPTPHQASVPYWLQSAHGAPTAVEPKREPGRQPEKSRGVFDPHAVRRQFPILDQRVNGHPLVWLDNAATTQKPQVVIDRLKHFYENDNSNIHRAAHTLAARSTDAYEQARETVRRFINAPSKNDVVFVRGTTEAINLVAQTWGRRNVNEGDEIVISWLEHHANIVPWHRLCAERKATLKVAPVDDRGQIIVEEYEKLLGPKVKLVAFSQVSNALGTVTPAREMIELAHRHGAKVLLDGAQAVSHMRVDVQQLDCDFYVFSGHKVFAPTGIGAVFGKGPLLEAMPPWQGGGNMIQDVTFERIAYHGAPAKFEAGTGNIADAVGLGTALEWLMQLGVENVGRYEHELLEYATPKLLAVPGLRLIGTAPDKAGVLSFTLAGQKTEEVGGLLDKEGIAVRSGHHCAQPILRRFGVEATVRASLAPYNTVEDLDALCNALHRLQAGRHR